MPKSPSPSWLLFENFTATLCGDVHLPAQHGDHFGALADHFAEFRRLVICLADTLPAGDDADAAWQVASHLDMWGSFMDDAREAAARAPETDLLLTRTWGSRLADIVREARHTLDLDRLLVPPAGAGSIPRHEPVFSLSGFAKPPPQPAARPTRSRTSHPRRRRR